MEDLDRESAKAVRAEMGLTGHVAVAVRGSCGISPRKCCLVQGGEFLPRVTAASVPEPVGRRRCFSSIFQAETLTVNMVGHDPSTARRPGYARERAIQIIRNPFLVFLSPTILAVVAGCKDLVEKEPPAKLMEQKRPSPRGCRPIPGAEQVRGSAGAEPGAGVLSISVVDAD